jgi:hypothetical protein
MKFFVPAKKTAQRFQGTKNVLMIFFGDGGAGKGITSQANWRLLANQKILPKLNPQQTGQIQW